VAKAALRKLALINYLSSVEPLRAAFAGAWHFQWWLLRLSPICLGELGFYLRRVVTSDEIGQLSVEVTDLNRDEPDAQKFVIPDGFLTKRAKHSDSPSPEN
jgi:hypothetical protein